MAQEIADSKLLDTWGSSGTKIEPDIGKIMEGWQLGEQPPHEYMNWLQNTFGSKLNHILKNGIAKWDDETEYLAGASVQHSGSIWLCETTNTNSEPTDTNANWENIKNNKSANTINDLKTKSGGVSNVLGYYTKGDGGGGLFYWDSTSTETDNGGTIIQATGVTTGRWKRVYSGYVNVRWFGAKGDGITDDWDSFNIAWLYCIENVIDLYTPSDEYVTYNKNFPFRQTGTPTSLLDCKGITVYGDGESTVFKTISVDGADVLQLNGLKNVTFKNLKVRAEISGSVAGSVAGSNGVSITTGYDNLHIDIVAENLPYLDKTTYVDGGKALTIQLLPTTNECGTLTANIIARGCAEGAGFEFDLAAMINKKMAVNVNVVAENCYIAFKTVALAATSTIPTTYNSGIVAKVTAINCQQDVVLNRVHGVNVSANIVTTKTDAQRRLNPNNIEWRASDTIVTSLICTYAKNSNVFISGNKGECDHKVIIGGTTAGSSGQTGETQNCDFDLDISGTSTISNFLAVDSGGNIASDCVFKSSTLTLSFYPSIITNSIYKNTTLIGSVNRLVSPIIAEELSLAFGSNGISETGLIKLFGLITGVQGKATSSSGEVISGLYDSSGTLRLGIRNGNGLVVDGKTTTAALGTYIGKHAVYDKDNVFIGYIPYYN